MLQARAPPLMRSTGSLNACADRRHCIKVYPPHTRASHASNMIFARGHNESASFTCLWCPMWLLNNKSRKHLTTRPHNDSAIYVTSNDATGKQTCVARHRRAWCIALQYATKHYINDLGHGTLPKVREGRYSTEAKK